MKMICRSACLVDSTAPLMPTNISTNSEPERRVLLSRNGSQAVFFLPGGRPRDMSPEFAVFFFLVQERHHLLHFASSATTGASHTVLVLSRLAHAHHSRQPCFGKF
jgi:hypothetical protein